MELDDLYFNWLVEKVMTPYDMDAYSTLLSALHDTVFIVTVGMDMNREMDGINLRHRFGYECNIPTEDINNILMDKDCTVLEVMVALAIKIEENVMYDPDKGNRTPLWFSTMIYSLHLVNLTNDYWDPDKYYDKIFTALNRRFAPNGDGGWFTLEQPIEDMRNVEMWYMAMWWLNEYIAKEGTSNV